MPSNWVWYKYKVWSEIQKRSVILNLTAGQCELVYYLLWKVLSPCCAFCNFALEMSPPPFTPIGENFVVVTNWNCIQPCWIQIKIKLKFNLAKCKPSNVLYLAMFVFVWIDKTASQFTCFAGRLRKQGCIFRLTCSHPDIAHISHNRRKRRWCTFLELVYFWA